MIYTEQHRELMRSVTRFIEAEINPHAEEWEKDGIFPAHELFKKMGDQGLLGIHKPEKFGGQGLDYSYEVAFCEALGANLQLSVAGDNAHHMVEACFKAFARALRDAVSIDLDEPGVPSTKGTLT